MAALRAEMTDLAAQLLTSQTTVGRLVAASPTVTATANRKGAEAAKKAKAATAAAATAKAAAAAVAGAKPSGDAAKAPAK